MDNTQNNTIKLNLGCGSQVIEGWLNVDYALGAWLVKIPGFQLLNNRLQLFSLNWDKRIILHDLAKQFPWNDNSVDIIYTSHLLEHFSRIEGRFFLSECFRVLKSGGVLRLIVPDLSLFVLEYYEGKLPADKFVETLGVLSESCTGIKKRISPFISFPHKCMYDHKSILCVLSDIGFKATRKEPFESDINDIKNIEQVSRTRNAVIVEAQKP